MAGMLIAILLRSRTLGTVEGGGDGSSGCAIVRLGEEERVLGGGGVLAAGSSAIEAESSWARAECSFGI
jgi:hypothetical protein